MSDFCPYCKAELKYGVTSCVKCGAKKVGRTLCPFCRSELNYGATACAKCGAFEAKENSGFQIFKAYVISIIFIIFGGGFLFNDGGSIGWFILVIGIIMFFYANKTNQKRWIKK